MINYLKALSFVLIAALIGGFNIIYKMRELPFIVQEVIYFVPFFAVIIWIGYFFWKDIGKHPFKSEAIMLKGIIIGTCLLLFINIFLNLVGVKYLDFDEISHLKSIGEIKQAREYGYSKFRDFIDRPYWDYSSLGLFLITLIVTMLKKWRP